MNLELFPLTIQLDLRSPPGYDRTRNVEIGNKDIKLTYLEEAYTTEHWLVRIYKVKDLENREPTLTAKQRGPKKSSKRVSLFFYEFILLITHQEDFTIYNICHKHFFCRG
jgi:hypothetical protein